MKKSIKSRKMERSKVVKDRCNDKKANFIMTRQLLAP